VATHQISWCHHAFQRRLLFLHSPCLYTTPLYCFWLQNFKYSVDLNSVRAGRLDCTISWHVRLKPITFQITSFKRIIYKASAKRLEIVHCLKAWLEPPHLNKQSLYSPLLIISGILEKVSGKSLWIHMAENKKWRQFLHCFPLKGAKNILNVTWHTAGRDWGFIER